MFLGGLGVDLLRRRRMAAIRCAQIPACAGMTVAAGGIWGISGRPRHCSFIAGAGMRGSAGGQKKRPAVGPSVKLEMRR